MTAPGSTSGSDRAVRAAAEAYVRAAWDELLATHVLPVPRWKRFLSVGRDYYGPQDDERFKALESALNDRFARFSDARALGEREFSSMFIHSLLQVCVARAAEQGDTSAIAGDVLDNAITELISTLDRDGEDVFCARTVTHISTVDGEPLTLGDVTITPVISQPAGFQRALAVAYNASGWGAGQFVLNEELLTLDDPISVLSAAGAYDRSTDGYRHVSARIDQMLMAVRLLWGATCDSTVEVRGGVHPIRSHGLHFVQLGILPAGITLGQRQVRRAVVLGGSDGRRIAGLAPFLQLVDDGDEDKFFTSIRSAYYRYWVSFQGEAWFDQIVDLATALEGIFGGQSTSDIGMKLRTRASALLATDGDSAGDIFRDIRILYDLRSRIVHGGTLSEKDLKKKVAAISSITDTTWFGVALDRAVDRLRDLVRRALLCRLALAEGQAPLWPLSTDEGVDEKLADDRTRAEWRDTWRKKLASFDAAFAADESSPLLDRFEVRGNRTETTE